MRPIVQTRQLDTADDNGISLTQSLLAAGNLSIDGAFATAGVAQLDVQRVVLLTSALDLSGSNFTITGTDEQGRAISETIVGPNASTVSTTLNFFTVTQIAVDTAIGDLATGILTLAGNAVAAETVTVGTQVYTWVAVPSAADEVDIGATASDSLDNLIAAINNGPGEGTDYGTGTLKNTSASAAVGAGDTMDLTSLIVGTAGNAVVTTETMTVGSFANATLTGGTDAVEAGTSGVGASQEVPLDQYISPFNVSLGVIISGTVNVTVQFTFDDIFDGTSGPYTWFDHADLTAVVANADGTFISPVTACRLLTNSGVGTVILRIIQAGLT